MREVLVHAPWFGLCRCDRDLLLRGVVEKVVAAGEAVVEFGDTPGCDDFDGRLEGVECKLEADLVVAFAGTAVGNGNAVFFLGHGDLGTCYDRPSERRSWQAKRWVSSKLGK